MLGSFNFATLGRGTLSEPIRPRGRFTRPRPSEVLFERICRENGITTRLTRPRTPTTTGKIERWHKTLRTEFLADHDSFTSLADAQAKLDAWAEDYNCRRPHRSLAMAAPASRFTTRPASGDQSQDLPLRLPPALAASSLEPELSPPPAMTSTPDAVEVDRIVPASGNMSAAGRQIWLGKPLARSSPPTACWPAPCPARWPLRPAAACTAPASPGPPPHRPPRPFK
jgi:hypothetical protein